MGETRHVHARMSTVLVMMAAALMTVVVQPPARAAGWLPPQCVEQQGGEVESVRCHDGSCTAIVDGAAYSVLVHEDEDGDQTFGVATYTGD